MFYKSVRKDSNKDMFEYLNHHFTYYTGNSLNKNKSIANCVKVYKLKFRHNCWDILSVLGEDDYQQINMAISDWEEDNHYHVGFNGSSGGYLVLYPEKGNSHVFASDFYSPCNYLTYKDWKRDVIEAYGSLKNYHSTLVAQVEIVQSFDKLCDDLIDLSDRLVDEADERIAEEEYREEHTHSFSATKHFEEYYYETLEDYDLHMKFMTEKGYSVYETNSEDLYTMFELNETINGEIFIDDRRENK